LIVLTGRIAPLLLAIAPIAKTARTVRNDEKAVRLSLLVKSEFHARYREEIA
jgi:hypothetical protein